MTATVVWDKHMTHLPERAVTQKAYDMVSVRIYRYSLQISYNFIYLLLDFLFLNKHVIADFIFDGLIQLSSGDRYMSWLFWINVVFNDYMD